MPVIEVAAGIVGAAAGAIALAEQISDWAERSCIIEIDNLTADTWELVGRHCDSGTLQEPVATRLLPFDHVIITAVSSDFAQGAVGELRLRAFNVDLVLNYSNPFVGDNDLDVTPEGARAGQFELGAFAGDGNKSALFRCAIGQPIQEGWHFCPKCHGMFNEGAGSVCPAGGPHDPLGWPFFLIHDVPEHPTLQANWRFCPKCRGLFFTGDVPNSRCPAGGPHDPVGWNYAVPHDLAEGPQLQRNWRFCGKCHVLFYGGDVPNSRCPADGPHQPLGWILNAPHKPV